MHVIVFVISARRWCRHKVWDQKIFHVALLLPSMASRSSSADALRREMCGREELAALFLYCTLGPQWLRAREREKETEERETWEKKRRETDCVNLWIETEQQSEVKRNF